MNRIAQLTFFASLSLSQYALAAPLSVTDIEQRIAAKQSDFDNFNRDLQAQVTLAQGLEQQLAELRENVVKADEKRQAALRVMNQQYEKVVDNPELDITPKL
jgi:septal ring factor EnvC (AmiA/AmiB activator)